MTSILNRLARKYLSWMFRPQTVSINDFGLPQILFKVHSSVERHRTVEFGGEREALEKFLDILEPRDVIYDVGASVGLFTISASVKVPDGTVIAFEPDPETNQRLRENVVLNDLKNVRIVDWAVSDSRGAVELYTDGAAGFAPTMRQQGRLGAPSGTVEIETRPIDEALSNDDFPPADVLKVDIEGAEALCLRGCEQLLNGSFGSSPRVLFIEVHPCFLPDYDSTKEEVRRRIHEAGYSIVWSREREEQEHLLCVQT